MFCSSSPIDRHNTQGWGGVCGSMCVVKTVLNVGLRFLLRGCFHNSYSTIILGSISSSPSIYLKKNLFTDHYILHCCIWPSEVRRQNRIKRVVDCGRRWLHAAAVRWSVYFLRTPEKGTLSCEFYGKWMLFVVLLLLLYLFAKTAGWHPNVTCPCVCVRACVHVRVRSPA